MKTVVVIFTLPDDEYPTLNNLPDETLRYYIEQGYLSLGSTYDKVPSYEQSIEHPFAVSIVTS